MSIWSNWSDGTKWVMGIVSALVIAGLLATFRPNPVSAPIPTPTEESVPAAAQERNITPDGAFRPSSGSALSSGAWTAESPGEQSIQFTFQGSARTITRIVFTVGGPREESGDMEHVLEVNGKRLSETEFPGGEGRMTPGDDIAYVPSQPSKVSEFRIRTLRRPGRASWNNIMVFGYD